MYKCDQFSDKILISLLRTYSTFLKEKGKQYKCYLSVYMHILHRQGYSHNQIFAM